MKIQLLKLLLLCLLPALANAQKADEKPSAGDASFQQIILKLSTGSAELESTAGFNSLHQPSFLDYAIGERQKMIENWNDLTGYSMEHVREMGGKADVFRIKDAESVEDVERSLDILNLENDIAYAERDRIMHPTRVPNDPRYSDQWHYYEPAGGINLPPAWDITTGAAITVAIVDTGNRAHPDLDNKILPGYDLISSASRANDGDGRDPDPTDVVASSGFHGVHVAGTAGAISNNGLGVAGVSWGARILPVRVLGLGGGTVSDVADGIRWAAGLPVPGVPVNPNPAKVINLSLGGHSPCLQTYLSAINGATASGALVVAAAGNSNSDVSGFTPANCPNVLAVAAVNRSGDKSSFSNHGGGIDVSAPGGEINDGVLSLGGTGGYSYKAGTSMAAPHVTGLAALALSLNAQLSPQQTHSIIAANTRVFPPGSNCSSSNCGSGIIDAAATLDAVGGGNNGPEVFMTASYLNLNGVRVDYSFDQSASPVLEFLYFPNLGNFEERPGGFCNTGQDNFSYFKIWIEASELIDDCSFQASWDSAPIQCIPAHIDIANNSDVVVLNTDTYAFEPKLPLPCELFNPLRPVLAHGQLGWFQVNLEIDGETYSRRVNFKKRFPIPLIP